MWEWHAWDHVVQDFDPTKANFGDVARRPLDRTGQAGRREHPHLQQRHRSRGPELQLGRRDRAPLEKDGTYTKSPGVAYGPSAPVWTFVTTPPTSFYAPFHLRLRPAAERQHVDLRRAAGAFFEVQPDGTFVWVYVNPVTDTRTARLEPADPQADPAHSPRNWSFRADRYAPDHPGLPPGSHVAGPLELPEVCEGDLSGDGNRGLRPISPAMLGAWRLCDGACPEDLDGSGSVGFNDLTIMLSRWGTCTYPGT